MADQLYATAEEARSVAITAAAALNHVLGGEVRDTGMGVRYAMACRDCGDIVQVQANFCDDGVTRFELNGNLLQAPCPVKPFQAH